MIRWKLDLVRTFMVCIDDSVWFLKACLCSSHFPFLLIFGAFSWNFRGEVLGCFFEGFLLYVTYEDLVPLCLVTLLQQTLRNGFNLVVFGGVLGEVLLRVDFRFLLIE
jgi:hypothetical protein